MQKLLANLLGLVLLFAGCSACVKHFDSIKIPNDAHPQAGTAALDEDTLRINAVREAQNAVQGMLKTPSAAKWPSFWNGVDVRSHARPRPDGSFAVSSYVDSQNSFGAMVRVQYTAVVRPAGSGWAVTDVRLRE